MTQVEELEQRIKELEDKVRWREASTLPPREGRF